MASQKMTFTLPEALATQFIRRVRASERSSYVTAAITERLAERERWLILSCEAANASDDVRLIEEEFDALPDTMSDA